MCVRKDMLTGIASVVVVAISTLAMTGHILLRITDDERWLLLSKWVSDPPMALSTATCLFFLAIGQLLTVIDEG